jgi:hypothetical protein
LAPHIAVRLWRTGKLAHPFSPGAQLPENFLGNLRVSHRLTAMCCAKGANTLPQTGLLKTGLESFFLRGDKKVCAESKLPEQLGNHFRRMTWAS